MEPDIAAVVAATNDNSGNEIDRGFTPYGRFFWGALVLLRELLCQNAASIFGPQAQQQNPPSNYNHDNDDMNNSDNDTLFATQVLATAIVLTGLASEEDENESNNSLANQSKFLNKSTSTLSAASSSAKQLKEDFLDLVDSYE